MTRARHVLTLTAALALAGCGSTTDPAPSSSTGSAPPVSSLPPRTGPTHSATSSAGDAPRPTVAPATKTGRPRGLPALKVDPANPSSVAHAFAVTAFTSDTRLDNSANDALRRARAWMTPDYARRISGGLPGDGGRQWAQLAARQGYTTATATDTNPDEQNPTDEHGDTEVLLRLDQTAHDRTGKTLAAQGITANLIITLTRTDTRWQVSSMRLES